MLFFFFLCKVAIRFEQIIPWLYEKLREKIAPLGITSVFLPHVSDSARICVYLSGHSQILLSQLIKLDLSLSPWQIESVKSSYPVQGCLAPFTAVGGLKKPHRKLKTVTAEPVTRWKWKHICFAVQKKKKQWPCAVSHLCAEQHRHGSNLVTATLQRKKTKGKHQTC